MRFSKGHGTGNDFVILPDPDGRLALTAAGVSALCDRRRGIGADGVLRVVRSAKHPDGAGFAAQAEWFMDYWNADGSLAEMCGNGVRVFTRYLVAAGLIDATPGHDGAVDPAGIGVPVATRAGVVRAVLDGDAIAVDMGLPRMYGQGLATLGGLALPGTAVDCGNPHLVCVLPAGLELAALDLSQAPGFPAELFPAGVNVEFVTAGGPVPGAELHVLMRVYERGSAQTESCGSGAVAVAAVALAGAGLTVGTVVVDVPGGRLWVRIDGRTCWLRGPAVLVAHGETDLAAAAETDVAAAETDVTRHNLPYVP